MSHMSAMFWLQVHRFAAGFEWIWLPVRPPSYKILLQFGEMKKKFYYLALITRYLCLYEYSLWMQLDNKPSGTRRWLYLTPPSKAKKMHLTTRRKLKFIICIIRNTVLQHYHTHFFAHLMLTDPFVSFRFKTYSNLEILLSHSNFSNLITYI